MYIIAVVALYILTCNHYRIAFHISHLNFLADRAWGHFWHLGLLDSRDAGDEVHLLRPPEPRPFDSLVPDVKYDEERDVDVY